MGDYTNKIKLIALDMDGTLLSSDHQLSPKNIEAIRAVKESGIQIVLASGRPPFGILPYADQLGIADYLIAYGGAYVLEIKTNKLLIDKPLLTSDALTAVQIIQSYGLFVSYFVGSEWYSEEGHEEFKWEQSILFKDAHIVEKLVDEVPPSPHKLLTIEFSDKRSLKSAYQALQETLPHINYNYARDIYFELYHPGADKANALAYLTGKMGVLADEVMAIGNGPNDLSMMSFAGLAVAVDNSPPELKSISAWTVASNDDDGVAEALEKFLT